MGIEGAAGPKGPAPAPVRVRFAPSPTGYLHVGGARTALFNWLLARHTGGVFVLRVEDTDSARYSDDFYEAIFRALRWLNLDWDEGPDVGGPHGPYRQRERIDEHRVAAQELLAKGAAYECFCDANAAECRCSALTASDVAAKRAAGVSPALRMRVDPKREVLVHDLIRGDVTFPAESIGDFVIVKNDGGALYNFAAVVDDHAMQITHVIRGDEHLANTPKQLLMYEAFGWTPPRFAHVPIILNEERRKLSKRDGATFVNEYEEAGYLPDALVNFMALLGWSPGGNREILTREEMIAEFSLDGVVKHPAIFDRDKLAWMNKEYMKALPPADLAARVQRMLESRTPAPDRIDKPHVEQVTALLQERARTIGEIVEQGAYFFTSGAVEPSAEALAKHCAAPDTLDRLRAVREALADAPEFSAAAVEHAIRSLAERHGVKAAAYIHPLRVAVTGQPVSPGIFDVCRILGRDVVLARVDALIARISRRAQAVGAEQ